jgi:hypothetical protein
MSMVHNILQYLTSGVKKAGIKVLSTFTDAAFSMCYHVNTFDLGIKSTCNKNEMQRIVIQ